MLAELSFIPVGGSSHLSGDIADAVAIIRESGLPFQLTPSGTCIEGEWEQVIEVVGRARGALLAQHQRMVTFLKLDDDRGAQDRLTRNVSSVWAHLGKESKPGKKSEGDTSQRPENLVVYDK